MELNPAYPGGCYSVDGPYSTFLQRREELLAGQRSAEHILTQKVKREVAWMKEGRKAQRIKQQSRKDDAAEMIAQLDTLRSQNRAQSATAGVDFDATGRKTRKLLAATGLGKRLIAAPHAGEHGPPARAATEGPEGSAPRKIGSAHASCAEADRWLFRDLSLVLSPGTRIGLLGANGSGKTTLIRTLTGELSPDEGTLQYADDVKIVVFDQKREQLPRDVDLLTALCADSHEVEYRGRRIHVAGWAQRFLFQTDQLHSKVEDLSGGEQARILLARMMLRPADVLILDEPTNDLDIATLDVLEESLETFPGAVLLVSHDRHLLDRVCTSVIGLNGDGTVSYLGDSSQWLAAQARRAALADSGAKPARAAESERTAARQTTAPSASKSRLTFKEKQELERIERELPLAEGAQRACQAAADDPAIASDHVELHKRYTALTAATERVDQLSARWMELVEKRDG